MSETPGIYEPIPLHVRHMEYLVAEAEYIPAMHRYHKTGDNYVDFLYTRGEARRKAAQFLHGLISTWEARREARAGRGE